MQYVEKNTHICNKKLFVPVQSNERVTFSTENHRGWVKKHCLAKIEEKQSAGF